MKKIFMSIIIAVSVVVCLTGCAKSETHKAYTFDVETGDKIQVELDTSGGYDLTSEVPFEISLKGDVLSQGMFIEAAQYEEYAAVVAEDANAALIDSGTTDSYEYIFWSYNDSEYDIAVLIKDSNTGVLLGNIVSEESAKECFERLTFSVE